VRHAPDFRALAGTSHQPVGIDGLDLLWWTLCAVKIAFPVFFGKWLSFQYVLSFVLQKSALPPLCFQEVLSFGVWENLG